MSDFSLAKMEQLLAARAAEFEQWYRTSFQFQQWYRSIDEHVDTQWDRLPQLPNDKWTRIIDWDSDSDWDSDDDEVGSAFHSTTIRVPDGVYRQDKRAFITYLANQFINRLYDVYDQELFVAVQETNHRYLGFFLRRPPQLLCFWIRFAHDSTNLIVIKCGLSEFRLLDPRTPEDVPWCVRRYRNSAAAYGDRGLQPWWDEPEPTNPETIRAQSEPWVLIPATVLTLATVVIGLYLTIVRQSWLFGIGTIIAPIVAFLVVAVVMEKAFQWLWVRPVAVQHARWKAEYQQRVVPKTEQAELWNDFVDLSSKNPSPKQFECRTVRLSDIRTRHVDFINRVISEINHLKATSEAR